ncbi:nuclear factor of activated T-cells 5 isoform X4 [Hermetia illucens]|uniref:nuclear factor of activated T-cells 5 isoform X4 n=1 Tax=Hermetia illucens TaxID=343691 RepID=UPI0018CC5A71|nr:nuclear factor of activated T-cells 5 isoform X4 [Hermetia illucens]
MRFTYPQFNNHYDVSAYRVAAKHTPAHQHKNFAMRMTMATTSTMTPRIHRKAFRTPSKRHPGKVLPGKLHSISRVGPGKIPPGKRINPRPHPPPCDNSNDSGFGFDQHLEVQQTIARNAPVSSRSEEPFDECSSSEDQDEIHNRSQQLKLKRRKIENILIDNDDACSNDAFTQKINATATTTAVQNRIPTPSATKCMSTITRNSIRPALKRPIVPVQSNISTASKNGAVQLQIISQPETQHRARYQTEGSRGAVKDRSGNGFPIVRLTGYNKPAVLQVFIGTDIGRVAPHMFYQACKVAGKNSTPCSEKKVDGTMIIEIDFKPESEMTVTCDCVGILKERNVDVEHRFPDHSGQRSKKKSTRCRMVFRTQLTHDDGSVETLQVCSHPIICTQPPGVPEICKKSLTSSPAEGGLELYIIGKNFLKDTCVIFQHSLEGSPNQTELSQLSPVWEETVLPDKEYLQQTHLICTVPPYINPNIVEPITVQFFVMSSGKKSEAHNFVYTPKGVHSLLSAATTLSTLHGAISNSQDAQRFVENTTTNSRQPCPVPMLWSSNLNMEPKHEIDSGMMPPPTTLPLAVRRPSTSGNVLADQLTQIGLKTEILDESSQSSAPDTMQTDSLDQFPTTTENSVDGSPMKLPYQRCRKQSVDLIDMRSISLLNDTNSLPSFPTHSNHNHLSVVDLHVKQEQMSNALQPQMLSVAAQNQQNVNKFLNDLKSPLNSGTVNSLFGGNSANNSNSVYSPQDINPINQIAAHASSSVNHTFTQNLLSNQAQNLSQMLTISQSESPNSMHSPSSSSSNSHSPLAQDIILNSEPAASISTANMQMIAQQTTTPSDHIPSELIMNPTVSPSMMCSTSADPNGLMGSQETMQGAILNDINSMAPQHPTENLLNSMMMNQSADQMHNQHKSPTASNAAAMNNMLLKATADFISNQENATINAALMSLNSNNMLNENSSAVSQMLDLPTQTQTTSASTNLSEPHQHIDMRQPQTTTAISQHIAHFADGGAVMPNHQLMERRSIPGQNNGTSMMGDLLLNQVSANVQDRYMQNLGKVQQIGAGVNPTENQESLLQAVSLVRNELEKSKMAGQVQQMGIQHPALGQTTVSQPTTATTIPQEITTMSDQDLISYINPSCFDQV